MHSTQPNPRIASWLISLLVLPCCAVAQTAGSEGTADRGLAPVSSQPATHIQYVALTQNERVRYYFRHMFSPESFVRAAAGAGIDQAMNTPSEWGQGASGYGLRFANAYGEHIIQSTSMYAVGAVLHEDNRYFQSGLTGGGARLKYALLSTVMGRHDDGSRHFSISRVSSYAVAAGISRFWQPPSTRNAADFGSSFAIGLAADAGFNVVREFFPKFLHSQPPVASSVAFAH